MANSMGPTEEQQKIIDAAGNIVVIARPGSGKTYTIVKKIEKILEKSYEYQGIIAISYTKKASRELEQRCKMTGISMKSSFFGTIDNFYISEIIMPFVKYFFNKRIELQVEAELEKYPQYTILRNIKNGINSQIEIALINALAEGHIFLEISGETALFVLSQIPEAREYIQAKYTHIFIDEYQDCGNIQHEIFMKMTSMGLLGIAVGDIDQAIYAFANRYSKYLSELRDGMIYRYDKTIAEKLEQERNAFLEKRYDNHGTNVNCFEMNVAVEQLNVDLLYFAVLEKECNKLEEYDEKVKELLAPLKECGPYIIWDDLDRSIQIAKNIPKSFCEKDLELIWQCVKEVDERVLVEANKLENER